MATHHHRLEPLSNAEPDGGAAAPAGAGGPASDRPADRADALAGGQPSISPPAKVKLPLDRQPQVLASGIDSLVLGIDVSWPDETFLFHLRTWKAAAMRQKAEAPGRLLEWPFLMQTKGTEGYEWLLTSRELSLRIGDWLKPIGRPSVMAEIRSETLWHLSPEEAEARLQFFLKRLCRYDLANPVDLVAKVNRVDLCLDLLLPEELWSLDLLQNMVSRAKGRRPFLEVDFLTGFQIGKGNIAARLYDKPHEIRTRSHKDWMFDIWGLTDVPEGYRIIRVEFQLRRETAKELGANTVEDLFRIAPNLWSYCTKNWLKLQDRPGLHHTQRTDLPWWKVVQEGFEGMQGATPAVRKKAFRRDKIQLLRQTLGLLSSWTALHLEEQQESMDYEADANTCLNFFFEDAGLIEGPNDFAERVRKKRAKYHIPLSHQEGVHRTQEERSFNQLMEGSNQT